MDTNAQYKADNGAGVLNVRRFSDSALVGAVSSNVLTKVRFTFWDLNNSVSIYSGGVEKGNVVNPAGVANSTYIGWNTQATTGHVMDVRNFKCYNGTALIPGPDPPAPPAGPNITITAADRFDNTAISNFSFILSGQGQTFNISTTNGTIILNNLTEKQNYNLTFQSDQSPTGFNQSFYLNVNITGQSFQANLTPLAPIGPNATINSNNFFNSLNTSKISSSRSSSVLLNLTFKDDIRLYGFEFNITNPDGTTLINFTNISFSGTIVNFTRIINIAGQQGTYTVGLTVWDSHTKNIIPDYELDRSLDSITFDKKIRISAEGSIWVDVQKTKDSYNFQFNYLPYISPDIKVFYVESEDGLDYLKDSSYKGHFVDWKNKRWIDFEGEEGIPLIEKINNKKYKIILDKKGSKVKFRSIGGLNSQTYYYTYYLSNISLNFIRPSIYDSFFNASYAVSLNVTGNARNRTQFYLYNSTYGLASSSNVSSIGDGTYFYNTTFNSLLDNTYYVNATHYDTDTGIYNASSTILYNILLNNCSSVGTPSINYTLLDENNNSRIEGSFDIEIDYTHLTKTGSKSYDDERNPSYNFTVCVWPSFESVIGDYTIIYEATGYPQRRYSADDSTFDNQTQTINLYLLAESIGIYGRFRMVDQYGNTLTGAIGVMKLTGTSTIIEQESSDGAGLMTFFLDPDQDYDFTFSKNGYQTVTTTLRVTTSEIYTITLNSAAAAQTQPFASGINYQFLPSGTLLQNYTNYNFVFNLSSSYWNVTTCSFSLENTTTTLNSSSSITQNGSSCVAIMRLNTLNQTSIIAKGSILINSTNITYISIYSIKYSYIGEFSLQTFLNDIKNFVGAGFNDFGRFMFAMIGIFIMVWFAYKQDFIPELDQALLVMWSGVFLFSYLGWLTIPYANIPEVGTSGFLKKYILFILISMGVGSYLIEKRTR